MSSAIVGSQSLGQVLRGHQTDRKFRDIKSTWDGEGVLLTEVVKDGPLDGATEAGDKTIFDALDLDAHFARRFNEI